MTDLEKLLDDDFNNIVPMHLRGEGVDTRLIKEIIKYSGNSEIYETLYSRMDLDTESAFHETVDWYERIYRGEYFRSERLKLHIESEDIQRRINELKAELSPSRTIKDINNVYTNYLLQQGLPKEKITPWRKFLLLLDANLSKMSGGDINQVEPNGLGLYSLVGYPTRKVIRYFMLEGTKTN
tara:strand:- start:48 stop:593 length:546 start_codon:yes stop_codon:yes gene_type:complete